MKGETPDEWRGVVEAGFMISTSAYGSVFLPAADEDLELVSRGTEQLS